MDTSEKPDADSLVEQALAQRSDIHEPHRSALREFLTKLLEVQGPEKFTLLQRLREPKNAREQNLLNFYSESDEDLGKEVLRSFAERPIDTEMLDEYHSQIERDLENVGSFLQAVIGAANECDKYGDPLAGRRQERDARRAIVKLQQKSEMYSSEMVTCGEFLADLNSRQGQGVIELAQISANSWHELVSRLLRMVVESWNNCSEIANKSRRRSEYAYEASASSLFVISMHELLPRPQQVYARVKDKYRRAKLELISGQADPTDELNEIEILETINSGLYGRVYKGIQKKLERIVAIKIIKETERKTADVIAHAKLLIRTQHPAVVTVHSVQQVYIPELSKRVASIVMEWLEGETFAARLSGERFSTEQAKLVCRDVIDGIAELHRVGLCHGDLHVGNVIVLKNGRGKIIDIDANKETSLSRMSLQSREGAMQSDIDYCKGIIFKTLRRSNIPISRLDDLEVELHAASSLDALRIVIDLLDAPRTPNLPQPLAIVCEEGTRMAECSFNVEVEADQTIDNVGVYVVGCDPELPDVLDYPLRPVAAQADLHEVSVNHGLRQRFQLLKCPNNHHTIHLMTVHPRSLKYTGLQFTNTEQRITLRAVGRDAKSNDVVVHIRKDGNQVSVEVD